MTSPTETAPAPAMLFCTQCGQELPGPGEACPACPAPVEARRQAVIARYGNQVAELRAIDAAENAKELQDAAGQKRALVAPVKARQASLRAAVAEKLAARREAENAVEDSEQNLLDAQRAARRAEESKASAAKRTRKRTAVREAEQVLQEDQAGLAVAKDAYEQAKRNRDLNQVQIDVLEAAAKEVERAAENPPVMVPPSAWTCLLANPVHLLEEPDLGAEGRDLVAAQIAALARLAGVAEELKAEGRAAHEAELADRTRRPAFARPLGDGNIGVIPNPLHPSTPQQFHPPGVRP